jgi:endonuclease/exonuclease/phosphatase family metal-dependent hydrolase
MFRKLTSGFFLGANILLIILFLFSCITPYLHPGKWWFTGFMGLVFPYLLAALLLFTIFWLVVHPRKSIYSIVALLLGYGNISSLVAFRLPQEFPRQKDSSVIRVMDWNLRYFVPFHQARFNQDELLQNLDSILGDIRTYQPDVLCFQEFFSDGENKKNDALRKLTREMGYTYHYFSRDQVHWRTVISGTAIFSRYPILQARKLPFPKSIEEGTESTLMADILVGADTVRIVTLHLQSFRFMPRDYQSLGMIKNQQDKGLEESRKILRKMRNTFYLHGEQADFVRRELDKSPFPLVITGDLNDVPNSYAYLAIRGKGRDAFLEKGSGIGKTYTSASSRFMGKLPTLRIDYIFTDPAIETRGFSIIRRQRSDHYAIMADLKLPKKE